MHEEQNLRLRGLASNRPAVRGPSCPAEETWPRMAGGLIPAGEADRLLSHAAECDACGAALRAAVECFAEPLSEEEGKMIEGLETSSAAWQESMARRATVGLRRTWRFPASRMAWAAAVLAACVGLAWWMTRTPGPNGTAQLLAKAYSEHRPFAARIAGARNSPVMIERGRVGGFSRPAPLLEAELLIGKELGRHPESALWLQLRGRAEMLDFNPDAAVESLKRALELRPNDPGIQADLGSACALRAQIESRPADYSTALEMLGRSLQQKPGVPEVVFNRALVYEYQKQFNEAIREWESYLRVDPAGGWADEARSHLEALRQKKK